MRYLLPRWDGVHLWMNVIPDLIDFDACGVSYVIFDGSDLYVSSVGHAFHVVVVVVVVVVIVYPHWNQIQSLNDY